MDYSNEEKIEKIRREKEAAIEAQNFRIAAKLRDEERHLSNVPANSKVDTKNNFKNFALALLLPCSIIMYLLYLLFAKNRMVCRFSGEVSMLNNDTLFWVYAAALIALLAIFVFAAYVTLVNKKK